jgi:hypothetical protein
VCASPFDKRALRIGHRWYRRTRACRKQLPAAHSDQDADAGGAGQDRDRDETPVFVSAIAGRVQIVQPVDCGRGDPGVGMSAAGGNGPVVNRVKAIDPSKSQEMIRRLNTA